MRPIENLLQPDVALIQNDLNEQTAVDVANFEIVHVEPRPSEKVTILERSPPALAARLVTLPERLRFRRPIGEYLQSLVYVQRQYFVFVRAQYDALEAGIERDQVPGRGGQVTSGVQAVADPVQGLVQVAAQSGWSGRVREKARRAFIVVVFGYGARRQGYQQEEGYGFIHTVIT